MIGETYQVWAKVRHSWPGDGRNYCTTVKVLVAASDDPLDLAELVKDLVALPAVESVVMRAPTADEDGTDVPSPDAFGCLLLRAVDRV